MSNIEDLIPMTLAQLVFDWRDALLILGIIIGGVIFAWISK